MANRSSGLQKSARKARGSGYERHNEILAATERIFRESGYEGVTIRKIADEVGVSPTALYMHFPDKHAILLEIGASALTGLTAAAAAIAADTVDAALRIRRILEAHMRFALANPNAYRIVFWDGAGDLAAPDHQVRSLGVDYYRTLVDVVGELEKAGRLYAASKHGVAQVMWAACHGLVSNVILNPGFGYVEMDDLLTIMLDGLVRGQIRDQPADGFAAA